MSQSSSSVQPPITPQQQDTPLPAAIPPGTPDVANPSEPTLANRASTNSSVEIEDEVNQPLNPITEHSAPEKSDRSSSASSEAESATTDDDITALKKAASSGDAESQFKLAGRYNNGDDIEENQEEAFVWYHKAAKQGHAEAQCVLGYMYEEGEGVKVDKEKAFYWYHEAAVQGDVTAQFNVGQMYDQGEVVKENKEKAFIWYLKAAEQGDSEAQLNVGEMYDQGNGVVVDKAKAFEWCQKAAQQGVREAMKSLCGFYKEGQGVEKDLPLATYWMIKHWFTSERFNTIKSEYNQLFEFMPSILANSSEFQKVISITFVWNGSNGDSYFSNLAKFIKVDSKIQILNFECLSNLNDFQANVIAEALKFNTQLTDWQWYGNQPSKKIANQIQVLLDQNREIEDLRKYVDDLRIETTPGFPLDIVKLMVDKTIVANIKSGQTWRATKIAIDEMLITAGMKPLEQDSKITQLVIALTTHQR